MISSIVLASIMLVPAIEVHVDTATVSNTVLVHAPISHRVRYRRPLYRIYRKPWLRRHYRHRHWHPRRHWNQGRKHNRHHRRGRRHARRR